jgi:ubiquinone/menaquinone biosynthesis C-methylase UbiE
MATQESFVEVAPYYDELMKNVPYRMWVSYYLLLLAHQQFKPRTILDVCCGTGTMCEMLGREGFEMAGLDLSPGMIAEAQRKAKRKRLDIAYAVADAAEFDLGRKFDAALSFFDSLNNILVPERLEQAFQRIAAHLEPGGSWIFDVNTAFAFETDLFDQEYLRPNANLRYIWKGHWDPEAQIIDVNMKFWYRNQEFREVHRQRAYSDQQIRDMLRRSGFVNVHAFHSYTLTPPRERSDRIHYLARRRMT